MITTERRKEIRDQLLEFATETLKFSENLGKEESNHEFRRYFVKHSCKLGANYWRMGPDPNFEEIGQTARRCQRKAFKVYFMLEVIEEMGLADPSEVYPLKRRLDQLIEEFQKYDHLK